MIGIKLLSLYFYHNKHLWEGNRPVDHPAGGHKIPIKIKDQHILLIIVFLMVFLPCYIRVLIIYKLTETLLLTIVYLPRPLAF